MDWEEKFDALDNLSPVVLRMRHPGNWFVQQAVEVKVDNFLRTRYGNGRTPEEAINEHWRELTELGSGEYLVVNGSGFDRRAYRWGGYMWKPVTEEGSDV